MPFFVHAQPCHFIALLFQGFDWIFDCGVFCLCGNDMFSTAHIAFGCAKDCPVITFCAAAGKENFFFFGADTICQNFRSFTDFFFRFQPHNTDCRRIAEILTQHICHFFRYFGQCSCRSGIVKINHFVSSLPQFIQQQSNTDHTCCFGT